MGCRACKPWQAAILRMSGLETRTITRPLSISKSCSALQRMPANSMGDASAETLSMSLLDWGTRNHTQTPRRREDQPGYISTEGQVTGGPPVSRIPAIPQLESSHFDPIAVSRRSDKRTLFAPEQFGFPRV